MQATPPPSAAHRRAGTAADAPLVSFKVVRSFAHSPPAGAGTTATAAAAYGSGSGGLRSGVLSFKEVALDLGPLDFSAHESFLAGLVAFGMHLPLADIWQVRLATHFTRPGLLLWPRCCRRRRGKVV